MSVYNTEAYAKINLFLGVHERLANGYHNISSVMQTVSLADTVSVTVNGTADGTKNIRLDCPGIGDNIAKTAAEAFFAFSGADSYDIGITIEKRIPLAAGLGGGSADAAAVIKLLNKAFGTGYNTETLCRIGLKVGADVPFCIIGGTAKVGGIGETVIPLEPLTGCKFAVVPCDPGISTQTAYNLVDLLEDRHVPDMSGMIGAVSEGNPEKIAAVLFNSFEAAVIPQRPAVAEAKRTLSENGALGTLMSGSGTAVFGIFGSDSAVKGLFDAVGPREIL